MVCRTTPVEDLDSTVELAIKLKAVRAARGGAFKPRTSPIVSKVWCRRFET